MFVFEWTDRDIERTARRAEELHRHLWQAPPALLRSVHRVLPEFADLTPDAQRQGWTLDLARLVIAREHGLPDWGRMAARMQNLVARLESSPLRDAVRAIEAGEVERLRALLDAEPSLHFRPTTHGHTLLGHAALAMTGQRAIPLQPGSNAQRQIVQLLLSRGVDPDAAATSGWTPLHTAAMSGAAELATILLRAGADRWRELWNEAGATPLSLALFYAQTATAQILARAMITPDNLRSRAGLGDLEAVRACFAADGSLHAQARAGREFYRPLLLFPRWTPSDSRQEVLDEALTWAARNGQVEAMAELHDRGADLDANPYRGTALLWAVYGNRIDAATWLLDHGADPDLRHDFGGAEHGQGATALHLAAQFGQLDSVRLLLERGADRQVRDAAWGGTPGEWAEHCDQPEAAALLNGSG